MHKLVVFVPVAQADKLRQVLAETGAGRIGNYDSASFSVRGVGRFRPLAGSHPAIGKIGELEKVEEERIEVVVEKSILDKVLKAVQDNHPYEEPAIDVYELKS